MKLIKLKNDKIEKQFFEIHKSALDNVNVTIFKVQSFIILILKVGKLR